MEDVELKYGARKVDKRGPWEKVDCRKLLLNEQNPLPQRISLFQADAQQHHCIKIVAAIATKAPYLNKRKTVALIEKQSLPPCKLDYEVTGDTLDPEVNPLHFDLELPSDSEAARVADLVRTALTTDSLNFDVTKDQVIERLKFLLESGVIARQQLSLNIVALIDSRADKVGESSPPETQ